MIETYNTKFIINDQHPAASHHTVYEESTGKVVGRYADPASAISEMKRLNEADEARRELEDELIEQAYDPYEC